jgi:hypothetical protein
MHVLSDVKILVIKKGGKNQREKQAVRKIKVALSGIRDPIRRHSIKLILWKKRS